jgi:sn-glycerol 3-phosphate transport system permease protein
MAAYQPAIMMRKTSLPNVPLARPAHRTAQEALPALLLLAPSLVFLLGFTYWPVVQVLWRSFVVQRFGNAAGWGTDNYARLFADPHFAGAALNNFLYAVGTIAPSLAAALGFALLLRAHTRLNAVLRTLVVMPLLIPLVAAAALFIFIFIPGDGLLDYYLAKFGVGATNWLGDPSLALLSIIIITVWKNTGYYMLFFLTGLAGIPADLHEAARLENASAWQRFRRITLPLLGPTIAFVLVIALLNALTQVDHVIVMTQGGPSNATNMLLYYIYQQAEQNYDPGLAAAATVVTVAVLFAISILSLRTLERGIHYES